MLQAAALQAIMVGATEYFRQRSVGQLCRQQGDLPAAHSKATMAVGLQLSWVTMALGHGCPGWHSRVHGGQGGEMIYAPEPHSSVSDFSSVQDRLKQTSPQSVSLRGVTVGLHGWGLCSSRPIQILGK